MNESEEALLEADRRPEPELEPKGAGGWIPPRYRPFAQAFEAERQALGAPGAAVAIIEHGRVTFAHGFGTKGPSSTEPVRASTLFRIGSMTKVLTATALLSLVDEHRVSLDAKLIDVVPDLAIDGPELASLTLRQVLSHQSGLADNNTMDGPTDDAALSAYSTSDAFRAIEYFMNPPGAFWNYSNPNFVMAGLAVERAGGVPYREAMETRVLEPLGMRRTYFLGSEVLADGDFANGKSTKEDGSAWDVAPDAYENSWMRPAGFAFSSVLDYARFVRFLADGSPRRVLSPRLRRELQRAQVSTLNYGPVEGYGLGLLIEEGLPIGASYYPTKVVTHGGAIPGFASEFYLLPETGFGIVVLANTDGAYFRSSLALALTTLGGLPAPTSPPPDVAVKPSTFPELAGTYLDPHLFGAVVVSVSDGAVSVSIPAAEAQGIPYDKVLVPVTADNFGLNFPTLGGALQVTFVRDAAGTYTWLRTRTAVALRQPASTGTLMTGQARAPLAAGSPGSLAEALRAAVREDAARWRPGSSPSLP